MPVDVPNALAVHARLGATDVPGLIARCARRRAAWASP